MDPMGRVADVSGGNRLSDPDEIYRHESLRGAQLAAFMAAQFPTCSACGCRRDHGFSTLSDAISGDPSDAAVVALRSDCGGALPSHFDATGPRGGYYLGAGTAGAVVCQRASASLSNLHHSHRDRLYSDRDQFRPETVPATTDHRLYTSRYR